MSGILNNKATDFFENLDTFLLKEEGDTKDNLKSTDEFDFLNSSIDLSS